MNVEIIVFAFKLCLRIIILFKDIDDPNGFEVIATFQHGNPIDELFEDYVIVATQNKVDFWCLKWKTLVLRNSHMRQCNDHIASVFL
jgi:hypothetical protein